MPARHLLSTLLEGFFPGRCLLCGEELIFAGRPFTPLCDPCLGRLQPIEAARRCRICSRALISEREICTGCRDREYAFKSNFSVFEYRGAVKELIYQYKFRNRRRIAALLAKSAAEVYQERYAPAPLVPVPAHGKALRKRGWDPVDLLARTMEKKYRLQVRRLLRRRGGLAQKGLDFTARWENIQGNIYPARQLQGLRKEDWGKSAGLVLLDDVFTTGATASECARVLCAAGVRQVEVLTLCLD